jgi:hypothetical protein
MKRLVKAAIVVGVFALISSEASAWTCEAVGRRGIVKGIAHHWRADFARTGALRNCAANGGWRCRIVSCWLP